MKYLDRLEDEDDGNDTDGDKCDGLLVTHGTITDGRTILVGSFSLRKSFFSMFSPKQFVSFEPKLSSSYRA